MQNKDSRQRLINIILTEGSSYMTLEQLEKLKLSLIKNLQGIILEEECSAISVQTDDTAKYFRTFIASKRLEGASEKSIKFWYYYTRRFFIYVPKNFREITPLDIQFYLAEYERTNNVCRASLSNARKGICAFFTWLEQNDYINVNPFNKVPRIRAGKKELETLTDEEIVKIREYVHNKPREKALVEFLLSTGVRISELCSTNIEDVNFQKRTVVIKCAKRNNGETRIVCLTAEAKTYLKAYLKLREEKGWGNTNSLFCANKKYGKRITERIVNEFLTNMASELEIDKHVTCHMFRKTVATLLNQRGMNTTEIAKYLGHSDASTSERYYIKIDAEEIQRNFKKYIS